MSGYWHIFDLSNGVNILRLICGLFFIPHIVGKFTEPATLNFFKAAKFNPPATWMYVAGAATWKVTKKWIWVIGGIEYCVFWMLACVALAVLTWPK